MGIRLKSNSSRPSQQERERRVEFSSNLPLEMFSSGAAGTPQRTTRRSARASRVASTLTSTQATPQPSPPQTARTLGANLQAVQRGLTVSPAPSRRTARSVAAASDVGSAMDVEEGATAAGRKDQDKVLVRDDSYTITERKALPVEVQQAVADAYTQPVKAVLDPITGFALLVSSEHCFVWNWSNRVGSTTTYVFPVPPQAPFPPNVAAYSPLSFASLVPSPSQTVQQAGQREPGLVVVSNVGTVRFWESVSLSLSGVDRFKSASCPLNEGELVKDLKLVSPTTYLLSTTQSRLFAINIISHAGRADLSVRPLERSLGWAGSVWSAVFGSKTVDPRAGILALALSQPQPNEAERTVYAVMEKNVQVWKVPVRSEGGERLLVEQDIFAGVLEALAGEKIGNEQWALNEGKVEIVDAAVTASGHLAVLISHVHDGTASDSLSFAIVMLEIGTSANSVAVAGLTHLTYQSRPDPRPLSTPRLSLGAGEIAFVVFADAVVIASIAHDSTFEEAFPLRKNTDRFLGLSMPSYLPSPATAIETLSLLTSSPSIFSVSVSPPQGHRLIAPGTEGYKTRRLLTRIEQAVFFGTNEAQNPLAFDLQPDFEGDLAVAAVAVSSGILASSSANMPLILDLRAQLADRVHRAKALIEYINVNGLLGKLPQHARRQLSWDAERLAAAVALWHNQNARLGSGSSLLSDAILQYMDEIGEGFGEDPLRLRAKAVAESTQASAEEKSMHLREANEAVLLALNAVAHHRKETSSHYGLDSSSIPSEPWSSRPLLLDSLQWHFEATDGLLRERVRELGARFDEEQARFGRGADMSEKQAIQAELKTQMAGVAEHVFSAFEERLLYLETVNGDAPAPELRQLRERYLEVRPRFIRMLVAIGKVAAAYELGERHSDFGSLVHLSNDPTHGSPSRIRSYLDQYRQDFAFPLYRFYLDQGKLRTLLEPEEAHRPLLTAFLDSTDNNKLAWINDVAIDRFDHASLALSTEAVEEPSVATKKLMVSLSKLAQVAQLDQQALEGEDVQRALEAVDDNLDLVNTQQNLSTFFSSLLSGTEMRMPSTEQGEVVAARIAPALTDRPALSQQLANLCTRVFADESISPEDLIDILSLKENNNEHASDFAASLDVLLRAKDLPDARRRVALENVWRRVYIQDDWAALRSSAGLKDEEMAAALRNTAFYATLAAARKSRPPQDMLLEPSRSFSSATPDELGARFPDLPSSTIDAILGDYEQEGRLLNEAMQAGLEACCKECVRMLDEEQEGASTEEELGGRRSSRERPEGGSIGAAIDQKSIKAALEPENSPAQVPRLTADPLRLVLRFIALLSMPSTASTSSHDPAPAPPPPDERIPLSSVPDVTKLFPPLIQDVIEDELDRNGDSAYYDEFEQLYWMYSGWDEERESFEREWDPLMIRMRDYNRKHLLVMNTGNVKARARLADEDAALEPILAQMNLRRKGPAARCERRRSSRTETSSHYGLDSSSIPSEPWSSRLLLLDSLQWHFETTHGLLRVRMRKLGVQFDQEQARFGRGVDMLEKQAIQAELKTQMADVVEYVFSAFEERLLYLEPCVGGPSPRVRLANIAFIQREQRRVSTWAAAALVSFLHSAVPTARTSDNAGQPQDMLLEPSRSFFATTTDELAARFPDLPSSTIDALLGDYEQEGRLLNEAMQAGLEACCKESVRLLNEKQESGTGEDKPGKSAVMLRPSTVGLSYGTAPRRLLARREILISSRRPAGRGERGTGTGSWLVLPFLALLSMPSTASTPSLDPAPAASPSDERIPLSSVPDLTKLFAPLIQEAIELELDGEEASSAYYDEFEQLYWMYSGWDEEREDFERKWDPLMDWVRDYSQRRFVAMRSMDRDAQKGLMKESADLAPKFALMNGRPRGPAGLAILRKRHFARHPVLDPA
ncbi:Nucleoporin nup132 [Rhodotorula toruloides]|nr:Nucleoporin nup132 [Rhodotorula toruloides]